MTELTADMKNIISEANLAFVATTNPDGSPSLAPKSSLRVYQNDKLLFANMASPGTVHNLENDPRVEVNCISVLARRGYRFTGTATVHSSDSELSRKLRIEVHREHGDTFPVHHAVLIDVHQVKQVLSPAYASGNGITEEKLRDVYTVKYGLLYSSVGEGC